MSHPATRVRGVTFVQNVGAKNEASITKTAVPFHRRRLTKGQPEEVVRVFNLAMEDVHAATLGARSIPFGGPVVVLQGIAFTNANDVKLAHRLKSAKAMLLTLAQPRLWGGVGTPTVYVVSVDDTNIVLRPLGTFTADVILGVGP